MTPTMDTYGPVTCLSVTGLGEPGGGEHHEIYLTPLDDPSPRTLLRQPVRPA